MPDVPHRGRRAFVIVLDSVGVGALPDAAAYGDESSDTVGQIAAAVGLVVPTLRALGLARVARLGDPRPLPLGAAGRMAEASAGKDSVTGHWELFGVVLDRPFPTFPHGFPPDVIAAFEGRIGRRVLGNRAASGTVILDELGAEHVRTGAPIVYTSADSVFQIAAHEDVIPPEALYEICGVAFDLVARGLGVGRVIARPFAGVDGAWQRTAGRRDFALEAAGVTLFDRLVAERWVTVGIGKVDDLFAGRGMTQAVHTTSDAHGLNEVVRQMHTLDRGLAVANLVDCDTLYGHRNDVAGYAANLERLDTGLAELLPRLQPDDLFVVTADHGNDPTTPSTDHSREYVPVLVAGRAVRPGVELGTRSTFADLGQTLAAWFGVAPLAHGRSFLADILR
ncbi:MAG TPA: phosphopentomutase [Vicinamibacterales bacterium]|nr:phosphopentomutase [Vicinamibacterales bacterium]